MGVTHVLFADNQAQARSVDSIEAGKNQEVIVGSTNRCMIKHHLKVARGK